MLGSGGGAAARRLARLRWCGLEHELSEFALVHTLPRFAPGSLGSTHGGDFLGAFRAALLPRILSARNGSRTRRHGPGRAVVIVGAEGSGSRLATQVREGIRSKAGVGAIGSGDKK